MNASRLLEQIKDTLLNDSTEENEIMAGTQWLVNKNFHNELNSLFKQCCAERKTIIVGHVVTMALQNSNAESCLSQLIHESKSSEARSKVIFDVIIGRN